MAATHFLPKLIGPQNATRLLTSSELISGKEAAELGIAAKCETNVEDVLKQANLLAEKIASNSGYVFVILKLLNFDFVFVFSFRIAVRMTLKTLRAQQDVDLHQSLIREADSQAHW